LGVNTQGAGVSAGAVSLAAGGGTITLTGSNAANDVTLGTVNGAQALAITAGGGDVVLGVVGGSTPLTTVTLSGNTIALQSVKTTSAQSYTGATTLNGNLTSSGGAILVSGAGTLATGAITVDTTNAGGTPAGANITFSSTLDGAEPLTLTAGTGGAIALQGAVGGTTALQTFTVTSANTASLPAVTTRDGGINVTASGITLAGNLSTDSAATAGAVSLSGPVTLGANVTIDTDAATTDANISFSSTIDADSAANDRTLTLTAGGGDVTLNGAVGGTQALKTLTVTSANTASLPAVTTRDGGINVTASGITLNGNLSTDSTATAGAVSLTGPVTLGADVAIDTDAATTDANITFSSTVNGGQALALTAGTGDITWTGAVGGTTRLGAITINSARNVTESAGVTAASVSQAAGTGTTTLDGAVSTTSAGGISIVTNTIAVNSGITTTGTGPVVLNAGGTLTIAAAGAITSDGAVALTGGSGVTTAGDVTTTGDAITFNSATTLSGSATLNSANGPITLGSTVSGTVGGAAETLTLNAGTGALNVNDVFGAGGVADATGLTTVTITDAGATTFNGAIAITGSLTQTNAATGATTFGGAVSVGPATLKGTSFSINNSFVSSGAVSFTASGAITGTGTLTSGSTLSLNASSVGTAVAPLALGAIPGEISGALTASADANGFNISSTGVIHIGLIDAAPAGGTARDVLLVSTAVGSPQIDWGSGTGTDIKGDQVTFFAPTQVGSSSNRLLVTANTILAGTTFGGLTGTCAEGGTPSCFVNTPTAQGFDTLLSSILSSMTKDKTESMSELLTSGLLPENVSKCLVYGAGEGDECGGDSPVRAAEGMEHARK
jgi:hypothetical protein